MMSVCREVASGGSLEASIACADGHAHCTIRSKALLRRNTTKTGTSKMYALCTPSTFNAPLVLTLMNFDLFVG